MFSLLRKVTPRSQPTSAILLADFARGKQDSPEGNETIYNKLKSWVQTAEDSEPYVGGPLHCLGGRSVVWGLWIPRADEEVLGHFPAAVASDLRTRWFQGDLRPRYEQLPERINLPRRTYLMFSS